MLPTALAVGSLILLYVVLFLYRQRGDALQDMVTGLPNLDFFERYLEQCIARNARHPELGFAVLLLEIRGFDDVRHRLGRFAAEEILADFAERVTWCIRPTDVIARTTGDDFAIALDEVRRVTDATRVAVRVHESMTEAMTLAARAVPVRLRIGVTLSLGTRDGTMPEVPTLLGEAEAALESARSLDRPYVVFDRELDEHSQAELSLESQLMASLDRSELRMAYAPLVVSNSSRLIGFSALLQWDHPERGLMTARNFIKLAESSREILRIGAWAVTEACSALAVLAEVSGRPRLITVNVSELELARGDVAGVIERALENHRHLAPYLRVEIPASALTTVGPAMESTVSRLRAFGVGVHLDQVASGSIPLRRALELGMDGVRISLASLGETGKPLGDALGKLVAACSALGREVVIEAIETPEQFAVVQSIGRPVLAQGFHFGANRSLDEAAAMLSPTDVA